MGLPKIDLPLYELQLFSTKKKVKYRPFTVKEEKILLIAQESDDIEQAMLAIKQVVNNCLVDVDVENLAMFDLEYILLNLRIKSIDNKAEFFVTDPETDEKVKLEFDLSDVKLKTIPDHTNKIKLNDEYTLFLKYPNINAFTNFMLNQGTVESNYDILVSCLDKVASENTVYNFSEFSKEEIDDFLNDLQGDVIKKIQNFFETMPRLRHEIKYKNSKGNEKTFVIEGVKSFFI